MDQLIHLEALIRERLEELKTLLDETNALAGVETSAAKYKLYGKSKTIRGMIELNKKVLEEVLYLIDRSY